LELKEGCTGPAAKEQEKKTESCRSNPEDAVNAPFAEKGENVLM
jgi:hypothetical protein